MGMATLQLAEFAHWVTGLCLSLVVVVLVGMSEARAAAEVPVVIIQVSKPGESGEAIKVRPAGEMEVRISLVGVPNDAGSLSAELLYDFKRVEYLQHLSGPAVDASYLGRLKWVWTRSSGVEPVTVLRFRAKSGAGTLDFAMSETTRLTDSAGGAIAVALGTASVSVAANAVLFPLPSTSSAYWIQVTSPMGFNQEARPARPEVWMVAPAMMEALDVPAGTITVTVRAPHHLLLEAQVQVFTRGITVFEPKPAFGDIDGNGRIEADDLTAFVSAWRRPVVEPWPSLDFNGDQRIGLQDAARIARESGRSSQTLGKQGQLHLSVRSHPGAGAVMVGVHPVPDEHSGYDTGTVLLRPLALNSGGAGSAVVSRLPPGVWKVWVKSPDQSAQEFSVAIAAGHSTWASVDLSAEPFTLVAGPIPDLTNRPAVMLFGQVSGRVSSVAVNGTAVIPDSSGRYSASLSFLPGENQVEVQATLSDGREQTAELRAERVQPAAIEAPSQLVVSAGQTVEFPFRVKDSTGRTLANPEVRADFPTHIGSFADGQITAANSPQAGTLTLLTGNVLAATQIGVSVGPVDKIVVAPLTGPLAVGDTYPMTVSGFDAVGNRVVLGAVRWSANSGMVDGGGRFTGTREGTAVVTAEYDGLWASVEVRVVRGHLQISASPGLVANNRSSLPVQARVVDSMGLTISSYQGKVAFHSSDTAAISFIGDAQGSHGSYTSHIRAPGPLREVTLSISAPEMEPALLAYRPLAQTATQVYQEPATTRLTAAEGSGTDLRIALLDQHGAPMLAAPSGTEGITVRLSSTGPYLLHFGEGLPWKEIMLEEASVSVPVYATTLTGQAMITGEVLAPAESGITINSVTLYTETTGSPAGIALEGAGSVVAGQGQTVVGWIVDGNARRITTQSYSERVTLERVHQSMADEPIVSGVPDRGRLEFVFTPTASGKWYVRGRAPGFAGGAASFWVEPGPPFALTLAAEPDTIAPNGLDASVLEARVVDWHGNKRADSLPITFGKISSQGATAFSGTRTVMSRNGGASVIAKAAASSVTGTDVFEASTPALLAATTTITSRIMGVPVALRMPNSPIVTEAGLPYSVALEVVDALGGVITSEQGRPVRLILTGPFGMRTYTGETRHGVAVIAVSHYLAGTYSLKAEAIGLPPAEGTLEVRTGPVSSVRVVPDIWTLTADGQTRATMTVVLVDKVGNPVVDQAQDRYVYLRADDPTVADFEGGKETAGEWTDWVKVRIPAGAREGYTADGVNSLKAGQAEGGTFVSARSDSWSSKSFIGTQLADVPARLVVQLDPNVSLDRAMRLHVYVVDVNGKFVTGTTGETMTLDPPAGASEVLSIRYWNSDLRGWETYAVGAAVTLRKGYARFEVRETTPGERGYTFRSSLLPGYSLTQSGTFVALPPPPTRAFRLEADLMSLVTGSWATLRVTRLGSSGDPDPGDAPVTVRLRSENTSVAIVPQELTIPAGTSSVTTVDGVNSLLTTMLPGQSGITAEADGYFSNSLVIHNVMAGVPSRMEVDPILPARVGSMQELSLYLTDSAGTVQTRESSGMMTLMISSNTPWAVSAVVFDYSTGKWNPYLPGMPVRVHKGRVKFGVTSTEAGTVGYSIYPHLHYVPPFRLEGSFSL